MPYTYTNQYSPRRAFLIPFIAFILTGAGCAHIGSQPPSSASDPMAWDAPIPPGSFAIAKMPEWVSPVEAPGTGPKAPLYFRLLDTQLRFGGKGETDAYTRFIVGGTDSVSLQKEGQQAVPFDPKYQKFILHTVGIWRNGKQIDVTKQVTPRFLSADRAQNTVFMGKVNVLIQIPDFRAGDQVELAWTVSGKNPIFGSSAWSANDWARKLPIWRRHAAFRWQETEPLRISLLSHTAPDESRVPHIKRTDTTRDGWTEVRFTDTNVPALSFQPHAASGSVQSDVLVASSFQDWDAVSAWAGNLFDEVEPPKSEEFQNLVKELGKLSTPSEQIASALQWVQREIRYVSVSIGENSHRPYSPDDVLSRRYGDCKDTALLLVHLLRSLGIESRPALMNTLNARLVRRLDATPWFNHAVAVAWLDGQPHILDGTARGQKSPLERLGALHGGADIFVAGGAHPGFLRAPYSGSIEERTLLHEKRMVIDTGTQEGIYTSRLVLRGTAAEKQRNEIAAKELAELKRNYLFEIQQLYPNASWVEGPEVQDNVETNELSIRAVLRIPQPLKRSGKNWRSEYAMSNVTDRLPKIGGSARKIPVALDFGIQRAIHTYTLDVLGAYRIDEEEHEETIASPAFTATIRRQRPSPTRLIDTQELTLLKDTVEQAEIPAHHQATQEFLDFRPEIRLAKTSVLCPAAQDCGAKRSTSKPPAPTASHPTRTATRRAL